MLSLWTVSSLPFGTIEDDDSNATVGAVSDFLTSADVRPVFTVEIDNAGSGSGPIEDTVFKNKQALSAASVLADYVIASGSNRVLIVAGAQEANGAGIDTVTYGSTLLTTAVTETAVATNDNAVGLFYLLDTDIGSGAQTKDITVNFSVASGNRQVLALTMENARQDVDAVAANSKVGSQTSISSTIVTSAEPASIITALSIGGPSAWTPGSGQTLDVSIEDRSSAAGLGHKIAASSGAQSISWSGASQFRPAMAAVAFGGVAGAADAETLRFSDVGYTTDGSDTPADTHFDARATQPLLIQRSALSNGRLGGRAAFDGADIVLDNTDRSLDDSVNNNSVDGRAIEIKIGNRQSDGSHTPFADFQTVFIGTASGWTHGQGDVRVSVESKTFRLAQPIQENRYAGSGGAEGGDDLKGQPKPLLFGRAFNIPAPRLNNLNIYQINDGRMDSAPRAFDRGVELDFSADFADYDALAAASIPAGRFATALAGGYVRLGSDPSGTPTFDARGVVDSAGTYLSTAADIIKHIVTAIGSFAEADILPASFERLNIDVPHEIGIWIGTSDRDQDAVIDEIVSSIEAFWGDSRQGLIQVGIMQEPAGSVADSLDENELLDFTFRELPDAIKPAVFRTSVGYAKNYFVQTTDLDANISESRLTFIQQEFRFPQPSTDSAVSAFHPEAKELVVNGLFADAAGATAHQDRLLALYTRGRRMATARFGHHAIRRQVGNKISLSSDRYGLSSKKFLVVGTAFDARNMVAELELFG